MTVLELVKGTDFELVVKLFNDDDTAIDLTGYTGQMKFRRLGLQGEAVFEPTSINIVGNRIEVYVASDLTKDIENSDLFATLQLVNDQTGAVEHIENFNIKVIENTNL